MRQGWSFVLAWSLIALSPGCASPFEPQSSQSTSPQATPQVQLDPLANLEKSIVFSPSRYPAGNWQPKGLTFEDAWFNAADGTRIHGWYVPHPHPRAVVLFCHGNGGNLADWAPALRKLHDRVGVTVFGFDYRGYGRSEGTPTEAGVLADARAARTWLAQRSGLAENQLVIMGRSLGGGVAVDLAADGGARALVLESTFTSIPDVGKAHYPLLPVKAMMRIQFNSLAKIPKYHGPLLQSHGDADRLIPYRMARTLFDAANEPKEFFTVRGGDHNDPQPAAYYEKLVAFLDRTNAKVETAPVQPRPMIDSPRSRSR